MSAHPVSGFLVCVIGLLALAPAAIADPPLVGDNDCIYMPFMIEPPPSIGEPTAIVRFEAPFEAVNATRPSCAGNFAVYNDIWVGFLAEATAYEVNLCGPSTAVIPDLVATAYRILNPANPCGSRVEFACIDNAPLCGDHPTYPGLLPRLNLYNLVVGQRYVLQFMIRGYGAADCNEPPCSQGDYTLVLTPVPPPACFLSPPPEIPRENEFAPCTAAMRVNDGCEQWPPAFGQFLLGASRFGTSYNVGSARDADWYRVVIEQPGTALTARLIAEFDADLEIIAAAPGQPCVQTTVAETAYLECEPERTLTAFVDAGAHYIVVRPAAGGRLFDCEDSRRNYSLTIHGTPNLPATGACCQGAACEQTTSADCDATGRRYYGDGSTCAGIACFMPPPSAIGENESMFCPANGHVNSLNGGCEFSNTAPPFLDLTIGQPRAGVSGTMFNASPPGASENQRDSDWYRFNLTGVPVGEIRNAVVHVQTEFPAEVLIVNPLLGSAPCSTWQEHTVADAFVEPGVPTVVQACVLKRPGLNFFKDVWIVIRPAWVGTPREIPCGVAYAFTAELEPCDGLGACCLITPGGASSGCQLIAGTDCVAQGGHFFGENTQCAEACCPCEAGLPSENEPACGNPVDNVNGGCGSPTLAFGAQLAAPGNTVCGTSRWAGASRDTDWFVYNHTGGDIVFSVLAEFVPQAGIIEPGPGATPSQQCYGFQILAMSTGSACLPHVVSRTAPPGEYWLWLAPDLGLNTPFECGAPYRAAVTSALTPASCNGDVNCDGGVDFFDIDGFVEALGCPAGAGWPHACPWLNADCDGDGDVDFFDIDPFVARLGASCP